MGDIVEALRAPGQHFWAAVSIDELNLAADEIEQLRVDKDVLSRAYQGTSKRVEELEKLFDTQRELYEASVARVEELEKERDDAEIELWYPPDGIYITRKRIDAAWATRVGDGDFISASELRIFECEGCDGKGFDKKFGGGRWDLTCPYCKGHKWVLRG